LLAGREKKKPFKFKKRGGRRRGVIIEYWGKAKEGLEDRKRSRLLETTRSGENKKRNESKIRGGNTGGGNTKAALYNYVGEKSNAEHQRGGEVQYGVGHLPL